MLFIPFCAHYYVSLVLKELIANDVRGGMHIVNRIVYTPFLFRIGASDKCFPSQAFSKCPAPISCSTFNKDGSIFAYAVRHLLLLSTCTDLTNLPDSIVSFNTLEFQAHN